jgi:iron complex outermembrane receptor protein
MINKHFSRGVSATALLLALASMPASAQEALPAIDVGAAQPQPAAAAAAPPATDFAPGFTPERQKLPIYRDPPGQTMTTVDTKHFENESISTIADIIDYSPGVTAYQGNNFRDVIISIRGSGARSSTGLANILVLEDGFSITPTNGGGTSINSTKSLDPHEFGAIDVYRGGSSALWGNYAIEGAVNFRMRTGAEIDGFEIGSEAGSFNSYQNWMIAGKKSGDFDISFFASDSRTQGYMFHTATNTQTFDFLGTWSPTPTDRVTLKVMQNDFFAQMDGRETWMQYLLNPSQRGYGCAYLTALNSPFCAAVNGTPLPANGITSTNPAGAPKSVTQSPDETGFKSHTVRDFVGLRYEHDFDKDTTWRVQGVYNYIQVNQPNVPTAPVDGPSVALDFQTDLTTHVPIFGLQSRQWLNLFYTNTHFTNNAYWAIPYEFGEGASGAIDYYQSAFASDMGFKFRDETALTKDLTAVVGVSSTWSKLWGYQDTISYVSYLNPVPSTSQPSFYSAAHAYQNWAPEGVLTYRVSPDWTVKARYETGFATPQAGSLFTNSSGEPGNNTSLKPQTSQGFDLGADWAPAGTNLKASVTIYNEWWRNMFLTELASNDVGYTTGVPGSIHRGVEAWAEWKFWDGWKLLGNYSYNDQYFTDLFDMVSGSTTSTNPITHASTTTTTVMGIERAGNRLPGVSKHQFTGRVAYEQPNGYFKGFGGYVEYVFKSDYPMDNGNLVWAPGYGLINLGLHYNRDIENSYIKKVTVYFDVKNVFDRTYFATNAGITDSLVNAQLPLQQNAAQLSNSISVLPGNPRAFYVGMKLKF